MHERIRERRAAIESDGRADRSASEAVPTSEQLIRFESRLAELQHTVSDDRLRECLTIARSSRVIVEMNEKGGDQFLVLMPCAAAAVRQLQLMINQIASEAHDRLVAVENTLPELSK